MFCSQCGIFNDESSTYCKSCGNKLNNSQDETPHDSNHITDFIKQYQKQIIIALSVLIAVSVIGIGIYSILDSQKREKEKLNKIEEENKLKIQSELERKDEIIKQKQLEKEQTNQEINLWKEIENSQSIQDFENYLKKFPNGSFAVNAQQKIIMLNNIERSNTQSTSKENFSAIDSPDKAIQEILESAGTSSRVIALANYIREQYEKSPHGNRKVARELNKEGLIYLNTHNYEEAVELFYRAYKTDPVDVEIVNNLGEALLGYGDLNKAEEFAKLSILLQPDRSIAWSLLSHIYAQKNNPERSFRALIITYRFSKNPEKLLENLQNLSDNENTHKNFRKIIKDFLKTFS